MKKIEIYFVRHGQSVANVNKLVTGDFSDPLTEEGRLQAARLGQYCQDLLVNLDAPFDLALVSPFRRAQETANIAFPQVSFTVEPLLAETDAGQCKNWTLTKFNNEYPDFFTSFDASRPFLEGESHIDLLSRVVSWITELIQQQNYKKILAVAHNGSLSMLLQWAFNVPAQRFPAFQAPNASITILELSVNSLQDIQPCLKLLGARPTL